MVRGRKHGESVMKHLFSVLAFLALSLPCSAFAEWSVLRGAGPEASFESTARPTVAVKASPGLAVVAQGRMTVSLTTDRSFSGTGEGLVWYCLSAGKNTQLAVALADAGSRFWAPGIMGTNLEFLPVLYGCSSDRYGSVTQRVFVRPVHLDPWMPAFAGHGAGWTAGVLVSQYVWILDNGGQKLLVEYREPLASEGCPMVDDAALRDFVHRADTAFSARFGENGDISASSLVPYAWERNGVSPRLISAVLGTTTERAF